MDKQQIISDINSYLNLGENWDGYGGIPLEPQTATNAKLILDMVGDYCCDLITDYCPNPHGTLTIDWEDFVSLEIGNNTFSYFTETGTIVDLAEITSENIAILVDAIKNKQ